MKAVLEAVTIPVHVMARPHDRGFTYRGAERLALLRDVSRVAKLKPATIVAGALDERRHVDLSLLREILDAAEGLPMAFHRALDELADSNAGFDVLKAFGQVERVLTRGTCELCSQRPRRRKSTSAMAPAAKGGWTRRGLPR